ncbi:MAG: flagellar basal body rod protein FlgB [Clostridiales bacterium]|nr:flagellar basal body rod protein FlgB [Clostridiales bacterium]
MIKSNAFNYINVLNKAADASWLRNEIIANNLANINTPNFKRSDVDFESVLRKQLKGSQPLDRKVANVNIQNLKPVVYKDHANLSYRLDGNNVDIDIESANLAENQIKYNAIVDSISHEFNRIKTVLNGL